MFIIAGRRYGSAWITMNSGNDDSPRGNGLAPRPLAMRPRSSMSHGQTTTGPRDDWALRDYNLVSKPGTQGRSAGHDARQWSFSGMSAVSSSRRRVISRPKTG